MDAPFVPQGTLDRPTPTRNMPILTKAQLEAIADIIATLPEEYRDQVALRFAFRLPNCNGRFLRERFLKRCGVETVAPGSLAAGKSP